MRKFIAPVFFPVVAVVLSLVMPPGSASASVYEAQSHTSTITVSVVNGDSKWKLAERWCGGGWRYRAVVVRSKDGVLRGDTWIYVGDRATISCAVSGSSAPRTSTPPNSGWVRPVVGARFGRGGCFGDPRDGGTRRHKGVDLSLPTGRTILAAHGGTVVRAGWWSRGYGISVLVSHGSGLYTHYAHMSSKAVTVGQRVRTGQMLGRVGSTGHSTGPHLHYEVWAGWWQQINPRRFMATHGVSGVGC